MEKAQDLVRVKFVEDREVKDHDGKVIETFTAGETYRLNPASARRWVNRAAAEMVDGHGVPLPPPPPLELAPAPPAPVPPLLEPTPQLELQPHEAPLDPRPGASVAIPDDWKDLHSAPMRAIADKISGGVAANKADAVAVIEAELALRAGEKPAED